MKSAYKLARTFDPDASGRKPENGTFRQAGEDFILNYVDAEGLRSKKEIVRCLTRYVYPQWGSKPFLKIRRGEVTALRDEIKSKNGKRQANMVLSILSKLFNWYAVNRRRGLRRGHAIIKGMRFKTSTRDRVLTPNEIKAVWSACEGTFGAIVKVLLITAQRREKVVSMQWSDLNDGTWTISAEDREKSRASRQPKH